MQHLGWDGTNFVLWKSGRKTPVALISLEDAIQMASTIAHVRGQLREAEKAAETTKELWHLETPGSKCPLNFDTLVMRGPQSDVEAMKRCHEQANTETFGCLYEIRESSV